MTELLIILHMMQAGVDTGQSALRKSALHNAAKRVLMHAELSIACGEDPNEWCANFEARATLASCRYQI